MHVCWYWQQQRKIPPLSYGDLYKDPAQMVCLESKQWLINCHDYEVIEKHLWRSLNLSLSGLASWLGRRILLSWLWYRAISEHSWHAGWRRCEVLSLYTFFFYKTGLYFDRRCCKYNLQIWPDLPLWVCVSEIFAITGCLGKLMPRSLFVWRTHTTIETQNKFFFGEVKRCWMRRDYFVSQYTCSKVCTKKIFCLC